MDKRNFSRSNVNESTLKINANQRSGFDLSYRNNVTLPLGKFIPVHVEKCMPSDLINGKVTPEFQLEKLVTPTLPRTRVDLHTFAVSANRFNKDFRNFYEQRDEGLHLPYIDYSFIVGQLLAFLINAKAAGESAVEPSFSPVLSTDSAFYTGLYSAISSTEDTVSVEFAIYLFYSAVHRQYKRIIEDNVSTDSTHYNLDFITEERERLARLIASAYRAYLTAKDAGTLTHFPKLLAPSTGAYINDTSFLTNLPAWQYVNAICEVLKPYFGVGSLADNLGYPVYHPYSVFACRLSLLLTKIANDWEATGSYTDEEIDFEIATFFKYFAPENFLMLYDYNDSDKSFVYKGDYSQFTEDFIRLSYSAWYDQLRNWHVESRKNLPDPDTWATTSIFGTDNSTTWTYANFVPHYYDWCCFLVPRYCTYSRDYFTTIQTDDVYRHVWSPVFNGTRYDAEGYDTDTDSLGVGSSADYSLLDDVINGVTLFYEGADSHHSYTMPSGLFRQGGVKSIAEALKSDLQTMRRANMLENYLARCYYNPDTYAGQLYAHYGVEPKDLSMLSAVYIGGAETLVGDDPNTRQVVTSTGTDDTPAGTRTMVAEASLSSQFQYYVGGDFVYLITFASIVPMLSYDEANGHLHEIWQYDIPFPEFANDARVQIAARDLVRGFDWNNKLIGYVPRYYQYRCRGDQAHGRYLTDYRSLLWLRDYYQVHGASLVSDPNDELNFTTRYELAINAYSLHVHAPLDMFLGLREGDAIAYGQVYNEVFVDRQLPAAVEVY